MDNHYDGNYRHNNHKKFAVIIPNQSRAVASSENPGGLLVLGGDNVPPLVEIGLAGLPKNAQPPLATGLHCIFNSGSPSSNFYYVRGQNPQEPEVMFRISVGARYPRYPC